MGVKGREIFFTPLFGMFVYYLVAVFQFFLLPLLA